jgi:hypothetical protein
MRAQARLRAFLGNEVNDLAYLKTTDNVIEHDLVRIAKHTGSLRLSNPSSNEQKQTIRIANGGKKRK